MMSESGAKGTAARAAKSSETARELLGHAKRITRRKFPAEEKIRILLEGIRAEISMAELCRREGIHPTVYYSWLKDFMEAGKGRMRGDSLRAATTAEVQPLKGENERLKQLVAELSLQNLTLKKSLG
jgi:transposase